MVDSTNISPPPWLTRGEKSLFRQVLEARNAMGRPVSLAERDALADYAATRRRIVRLRAIEAEAKYASDKLVAAGAVSAATKLARQLGRDLGLGGVGA